MAKLDVPLRNGLRMELKKEEMAKIVHQWYCYGQTHQTQSPQTAPQSRGPLVSIPPSSTRDFPYADQEWQDEDIPGLCSE
eukprot:scaffold3401_cov277-Alexandrium_tamarense.AAC.9